MKIGIIGSGYVGLVSGACFSGFGHEVICLDKNKEKIENLIAGSLPIYEPGLERIVEKNMSAGRLKFDIDIGKFLQELEVIFVAVDTPTNPEDGQSDLTALFEVTKDILLYSKTGKTIVIKSTVPVGTNAEVSKILNNNKLALNFDVVSNPEFLREGSAIDDFMKPDRVIIGTKSKSAAKIMANIYKPLYLREFPIIYTDPESAETIKYSSNAFLATKISFINEVAALCEKTGADVKEVAKGMGLDRRIGNKFLHAGPGYGGSCFPKDTVAFTKTGRKFGVPLTIVETVIKTNETTKRRMIKKIVDVMGGTTSEKIICCLGVTFKPNTDDMREAPSLTIIPELFSKNTEIRVVDPKGKKEGKDLLGNVKWYLSPYLAVEGADLVIIMTEWNEFRALNLKEISKKMRTAFMADLRNVYTKKEALKNGFIKYECVGRNG